MRLLVTGGAGFIGSNFARYWVRHHPDAAVVVFDVLTYAGNRPNLADIEDQISFVQGDIGDLEGVSKALAEHEIDVIVNFAAESHNSLAILDPARFFRTNVLGTQTLAEAARRHGVARFHHISTKRKTACIAKKLCCFCCSAAWQTRRASSEAGTRD